MAKDFCIYILANGRNGTLYVGVTSNLPQRIWQHRNDQLKDSPANMVSMI